MSFTSLAFCFFFPVTVLLHRALPQARRWILLLGASLFFYLDRRPSCGFLLLACAAAAYLAALAMERWPERKNTWLTLGVGSVLGVLGTAKYAGLWQSYWGLFPIGLSFYSLQAIGYMIDVSRSRLPAERHPGIFALYLSFFPQLVNGPIERPDRLLPQLREGRTADWDETQRGLRLMLWGFFKKLVIADNLGAFVKEVYAAPDAYHGLAVWAAVWFFVFQLYCDFSGYCDIALGAARVLGIVLRPNFADPLASANVPDFWRRWNVTISSWFRDYAYLPLCGQAPSTARRGACIVMVFALLGLWHDARATFMICGLLNAAAVILSLWTRPLRMGSPSWWKAPISWIPFGLIGLSSIFFRAPTLALAGEILRGMFTVQFARPLSLGPVLARIGWPPPAFAAALTTTVLLQRFQATPGGEDIERLLRPRPRWTRWLAYYGIIFAIFFLGNYESDFIYFRF